MGIDAALEENTGTLTAAICSRVLLLEDVLLSAPSSPRRPVSEIPQEAHITSCADPAVHRHRAVQQDGRLVPQTVESHRVLDDQRGDIGAHPGPTS